MEVPERDILIHQQTLLLGQTFRYPQQLIPWRGSEASNVIPLAQSGTKCSHHFADRETLPSRLILNYFAFEPGLALTRKGADSGRIVYCFLASKVPANEGFVSMPKISVPPPIITMLKFNPAAAPVVNDIEPVQSEFTV